MTDPQTTVGVVAESGTDARGSRWCRTRSRRWEEQRAQQQKALEKAISGFAVVIWSRAGPRRVWSPPRRWKR